ncbi:hypothetical protein [Natronosalvus halobius]|uniref:hypothetical protein n=1 Tax=Natronosalvus halobius TaxID=2953746 RepID=UPI0020A22C5A|nr:hypothetical protein [Natronosalvus halobius]USZ71140.1 hypothetical protein NGM15_13755 [Natronosalvus halobius]
MSDEPKQRRTVLKALAASGTIAAIGGVANAQINDDENETDEDYDEDGETIEDGEEVDEEESESDSDDASDGDDDEETTDDTTAGDATLSVDSSKPGATTTYTFRVTVGDDTDGDSLNDLVCDLEGTNVGLFKVDDAKVDVTHNGESVVDDLDEIAADDSKTVALNFGGSYSLETGDRICVTVECVVNPDEEGTYEASVIVNSQSAAETYSVSVTIGDECPDDDEGDSGGDSDDGDDDDSDDSDDDDSDDSDDDDSDDSDDDDSDDSDDANEDYDEDGETIEDGEEVDEDDDDDDDGDGDDNDSD